VSVGPGPSQPSGPPVPPGTPGSSPEKGAWWRRNWKWFAGALIGLIVGGAVGAGAGSGTTTTHETTVAGEPTTETVTVTAPAAQPTSPDTTPTATGTTPTGTATTPTPSPPSRLPAGAKDAFLGDCLAGYSQEQPSYQQRYEYCLCVVNHLEGSVTEEELFQLTADDPRRRNAEHACAAHLPHG
jgi:hypothetical protein